MQMIITSECENCIYSMIDEEDKSKVRIYCKMKNKTYYWGQCIPCEFKEVRDAEGIRNGGFGSTGEN